MFVRRRWHRVGKSVGKVRVGNGIRRVRKNIYHSLWSRPFLIRLKQAAKTATKAGTGSGDMDTSTSSTTATTTLISTPGDQIKPTRETLAATLAACQAAIEQLDDDNDDSPAAGVKKRRKSKGGSSKSSN